MSSSNKRETEITAWTLDQLAKSQFFHQKLHEWRLIETAEQIETIAGETLNWTLSELMITEVAWNRIIHRGIKPIIVFAHPEVLQKIIGATSYYRMLAMVSQKSMNKIGSGLLAYEEGHKQPSAATSLKLAQHLNKIICTLVEMDDTINDREFDLWRGMAAGSQAQGSWQNNKGSLAEKDVRLLVLSKLSALGIIAEEVKLGQFSLTDGRLLVFSSEPDIAIYEMGVVKVVVEIKGGIDSAGVLERIGATLKSLQRARQENPQATTILITQATALTSRALEDLELNKSVVNHVFTIEAILDSARNDAIERFYQLLGLTSD